MKSGDRVEWYNLFYQVREGVVFGSKGFRKARMDNGFEVPVDPNPERVFPVGTLDRTKHHKFLESLTQLNENSPF